MSMERKARFAGLWYPDDPDELKEIAGYGKSDEGYTMAVLPHAGLYYSAPIIKDFFSRAKSGIRRFIILSPSHYHPLKPDALYTASFTESDTPFGKIRTERLNLDGAVDYDRAIQDEHGIEMFLPFVKEYGDADVSYALISQVSSMDSIRDIASRLNNEIDDDTALIASSDFTHYGLRFGYMPYGENGESKAVEKDSECASLLARKKTEEAFRRFTHGTICGIAPALIVSEVASRRKMEGKTGLHYTSNDVTGDKGSDFVSYQSVLWRK